MQYDNQSNNTKRRMSASGLQYFGWVAFVKQKLVLMEAGMICLLYPRHKSLSFVSVVNQTMQCYFYTLC